MLQSLVRNHGVVDGNKRLDINGYADQRAPCVMGADLDGE